MYHAAILTFFDPNSKGKNHDGDPPVIASLLEQYGYHVVCQNAVLNVRTQIEERLREIADSGEVHLIVTIGGIGFTPCDIIPEATAAVCDRLLPGIPEAMRCASMQVDHRTMLSRAQAGVCKNTFIVNLPASPELIRKVLRTVLPVIDYGAEILEKYAAGCQRAGTGSKTDAFISDWLSWRI